MKHVKTFEGFFDFFKRKYSDLDQLVVDLSNKLKSKDVESINIDKFNTGVSSAIDTNNKNIQNVKYSVNFDNIDFSIYKSHNKTFIGEPSDIPLYKINSTLSKNYWSEEFQKSLIDNGAVKASSDLFYKLEINNEPIICECDLIQDLFDLVDDMYDI
jgi:hypothetical protein